jgi:hypothetical protein
VPRGHGLHTSHPARLYVPGPHATAVGLDDPAAHPYPAEQLPEQAAVAMAGVPPYWPAAHKVHTSVVPRLYVPAGHWDWAPDVDPAGQAYPAVHGPEQVVEVRPGADPNRPAGHRPLHAAVVEPGVVPYCPGTQLVHAPAPCRLYVPAGHTAGVADRDPATQK